MGSVMGALKRKTTWGLLLWTGLFGLWLTAEVHETAAAEEELRRNIRECVRLGELYAVCARGFGDPTSQPPGATFIIGLWLFGLIVVALFWFLGHKLASDDQAGWWLVGLTLLWLFLWIVYTPHLVFAPYEAGGFSAGFTSPGHTAVFEFLDHRFLFDIDGYCTGGIYDSVPTAALVGGVLWAGAGFAGSRRPSTRKSLTLGFVLVYALALVLLWLVAAPAIWGSRNCLTD